MPRFVIHQAAAHVGPTQACARCGEILQDYRNTMVPEGYDGPHRWETGAHVEVSVGGNPRAYSLTKAPPNCARAPVGH